MNFTHILKRNLYINTILIYHFFGWFLVRCIVFLKVPFLEFKLNYATEANVNEYNDDQNQEQHWLV